MKRRLAAAAAALCLATVPACASGKEAAPAEGAASATAAAAKPGAPQTEEQKTLYALGLVISTNLASFGLSESELEFVKAGITDGVLEREAKVELQTYGPMIQQLANTRAQAMAAAEEKVSEEYLAKAATEKGAVRSESGLIMTEIEAGTGASPKATDTIKVHYHGTLANGKVFDSSVERNEPVEFALNGVIPCWTEGLQKMKVGGKSRLVCPASLAYGDRGSPPAIKPGAVLVFDVELLGIVN